MKNKRKYLIISIVFDVIGMASLILPGLGEFTDVVWAPLSAIVLFFMYGKALGFSGGVVGFAEEILPLTDFIPTFTLVWIYNFKIKKSNQKKIK